MGTLKECYERCDVKLPEDDPERRNASARPAVLEFESDDGLLGADPRQLRDNINDSDRFGLISPYTEQGDEGQFYLTADLFDGESDKKITVRMDASSVRVFQEPKNPFDYPVFEAFIEHLEDAFSCTFDPLSETEVEARS